MQLSVIIDDQSKSCYYWLRKCTTDFKSVKESIKGIQITARIFKLILVHRQCFLTRGDKLRQINFRVLLAVFLTVTLHLTSNSAAAALNLTENVTISENTISTTFLCCTPSLRHKCVSHSLAPTDLVNSHKLRHCKQQNKICNCDFLAANLTNINKQLYHHHRKGHRVNHFYDLQRCHNKSNEYLAAEHQAYFNNNSTYTNSLIAAYNYDKLISNYNRSNQTSFRNSRDAKPNRTDGNGGGGYDKYRFYNCLKKLNNKDEQKVSINNNDLASNNNAANKSLVNMRAQKDHLKMLKLVMDGLGLQKLPNMKKINISQKEYAAKYRVYLQRVHSRNRRESRELVDAPLQILSVSSKGYLAYDNYNTSKQSRKKRDFFLSDLNFFKSNKRKNQITRSAHKKPRGDSKLNIHLLFALTPQAQQWSAGDIEEANVRLMLIHNPSLALRNRNKKKQDNRKKHKEAKNNSCVNRDTSIKERSNNQRLDILNLRVFHITHHGKRRWLDGRKVPVNVDIDQSDQTSTQWLQFNVTKAVVSILLSHKSQLEVELQCDNCKRLGARLFNDGYTSSPESFAATGQESHLMPALNIIGRFGQSQGSIRAHESFSETSTVRQYHHHSNANHGKHAETRRHNCYKINQRCCRHSMEVVFKEIKGFEFILQPKAFDAGYCHGRCPPRYNPAHHHAMLQSLIWKQDHRKAPRPCCAPSKLDELEILHVDEKDSEKLKISTWSDMRVVECACS
ncbi:TGF-beta domain-containing family member maverick [Glossina fuscipes fuscipes]